LNWDTTDGEPTRRAPFIFATRCSDAPANINTVRHPSQLLLPIWPGLCLHHHAGSTRSFTWVCVLDV
jgi:hypothetical protein